MTWRRVLVCVALVAVGCGDDDGPMGMIDDGGASGDVDADVPAAPVLEDPADGFSRTMIDGQALGASFADLGDIDADGRLDILHSHFGVLDNPTRIPNGRVVIYRQGESLADWSEIEVVGMDDGIKFPNDPTFEDVDGDGDLDVFVPHGFLVCGLFRRPCGGLSWFENQDGEWLRHTLIEAGADEFYHLVVLADLDDDGLRDIVTVAETFDAMANTSARIVWFRGTESGDRFEPEPRTLVDDAGGSIPVLYDVDEDGDLDIVTAEFFTTDPGFVWVEQVEAPTAEGDGTWTRHVIDTEPGPSIQMHVVEDLFEEGDRWAVGSNHVNVHVDGIESGIFGYRIPDGEAVRTETWERTLFSEGIEAKPNEGVERNAAPGIFNYGDVDNDGDIDFLVSGDGDPNVFWLEQTDDGFETHVLQEDLPQAGAMKVADLDDDGSNELVVAGYEHNVVLLFQRD